MTNKVFHQAFTGLKNLQVLDLSDCSSILTNSLDEVLSVNLGIKKLQLAGCTKAVDQSTLKLISQMFELEFLDLSYCTKITDEGLLHFKD